MKKKMLSLLASLLLLPLASYADCDAKKDCSKKSRCEKQESCSQCPIVQNFMKCAGFLLGNAEAIGLSEDQIKTIHELKTDMIKRGIQSKAGMEVFMIDIQSKLCADKLDVDGINKMIDEGSKAMGEEGKATLAAYAKLKDLVTPDQMKKCKELCKKGCQK